MTRTPLPARRQNVTIACTWRDHSLTVTIGLDASGQPGEVFCDTAKGGQMGDTLDDACVLISIALQHGVAPAELAKSLGRVPRIAAEGNEPASPIGAIMGAVTAMGAA